MSLQAVRSVFNSAFCLLFVGCLAIFGTASVRAQTVESCEAIAAGEPAALSDGSFWKGLSSKSSNGKKIIAVLSQNPELSRLFKAGNQSAMDKTTIEKHTLAVLQLFNELFDGYSAKYAFKTHPNIRLYETFKFMIALHDIGKPLAYEAGNKNRQHEFTIPILIREMKRFGFTEEETRLATSIVDNDLVSDFATQKTDAIKARAGFVKAAAQARLPLMDYAPLRFLFFSCDAGAYNEVRTKIFTWENSLMVPSRQLFERIWQFLSAN
jgi:hypothetical protein